MNHLPGFPAFHQTCYGNAHVPQARVRHNWSILPRAPSSHDPETICLGQWWTTLLKKESGTICREDNPHLSDGRRTQLEVSVSSSVSAAPLYASAAPGAALSPWKGLQETCRAWSMSRLASLALSPEFLHETSHA